MDDWVDAGQWEGVWLFLEVNECIWPGLGNGGWAVGVVVVYLTVSECSMVVVICIWISQP